MVLLFALWGMFSCKAPRPEDLGVTEEGRLKPCPSTPNCVSSFAGDEEHGMEPLTFDSSPEQAWKRLQQVIHDNRKTHIVRDQGDYMHVEFTTKFGFVDDVEFLLFPEEGRIHFRSASRIGKSDLGQNRMRMEKVRKQYSVLSGE